MLIDGSNYRDKTHIQIPCMMWTKFDNANQLETLAYYCTLRSLHKKPILYNCDKRGMASLLKVSYNTIKKHLKILDAYNIIQYRNGHVHLGGIKRLQGIFPSKGEFRTGKSLTITLGKNLSETKLLLKSIKLICTIKQVEKGILRQAETKSLDNLSRTVDLGSKTAKKLTKFRAKQRKAEYGIVHISNRRIAQILKRTSDKTAIKYKKLFKKYGLIDYARRFVIIPPEEQDAYHDGYGGCLKKAFYYRDLMIREIPCQFRLKGRDFFEIQDNDVKNPLGFTKVYSLADLSYIGGCRQG